VTCAHHFNFHDTLVRGKCGRHISPNPVCVSCVCGCVGVVFKVSVHWCVLRVCSSVRSPKLGKTNQANSHPRVAHPLLLLLAPRYWGRRLSPCVWSQLYAELYLPPSLIPPCPPLQLERHHIGENVANAHLPSAAKSEREVMCPVHVYSLGGVPIHGDRLRPRWAASAGTCKEVTRSLLFEGDEKVGIRGGKNQGKKKGESEE
jgi:hypothetical protein